MSTTHGANEELLDIGWPVYDQLHLPVGFATMLATRMAKLELDNLRRVPSATFTWKPFWMGSQTEFRKMFSTQFAQQFWETSSFWIENWQPPSTADEHRDILLWALENRVLFGPAYNACSASMCFDPRFHKDMLPHPSAYCVQPGPHADRYIRHSSAACSCYVFGFITLFFPDPDLPFGYPGHTPELYFAWRYTSQREKMPLTLYEPYRPIADLNETGMKHVVRRTPAFWHNLTPTRPRPPQLNPLLSTGALLHSHIRFHLVLGSVAPGTSSRMVRRWSVPTGLGTVGLQQLRKRRRSI